MHVHVPPPALLLGCAGIAAAQPITASVNDLFRYGDGEEIRFYGQPGVRKTYLEEQAATQVTVGDVLIGFRYQLDDPTELYNQNFNGIRKRYIEYRKDGLAVRAGNLNALFGRGLGLNLFENRSIYWDTELDGLKADYRTTLSDWAFDGTILAGNVAFDNFAFATPTGDQVRAESYRLQAGQLGIAPTIAGLSLARIGLTWVHATGVLPSPAPPAVPADSLEVTIPGLNIDVKSRDVQWYLEYDAKRSDVASRPYNHTSGVSWSGALYSALSVTRPGFGATLEYKNYHYDVVGPTDATNEVFRTTQALPFQNGPILYKEQSYTLATRIQHPVNFNDEVGFQFDGFYAVNENLTLNLNLATASRHFAYVHNNATGLDSALPRSTSWLPSFDDAYGPFWEAFLEAEYEFEGGSNLKVAFDRTVVPQTSALATFTERSTAFPMVKGTFYLDEDWSMTLDFQNQWMYNPQIVSDTSSAAAKSISGDPHRAFSELFSLGVARSPYGSLTAIYEWTTEVTDISGRRNWFLLEGSFRIGAANTFILSWGQERGGVRCSNGICRFIQPFNGWRLTMASRI